ncbi:MAG: dihydroorotase [Candidatus Ancillula trichonymphae]|jgi:dihydroorotase|nr:dihydroorotase [Candidatus Ancillula trichonymphae]
MATSSKSSRQDEPSSKVQLKGRLYGEETVSIEFDKATGIIERVEKLDELCDEIILPGLVDLHTHLREPGNERSETILTGSKAAAAGGYTCVHAMANTTPAQDTASAVDKTLLQGQKIGLVEVRPVGAVTKELEGEKLAELGLMATSLSRVRVFSDDGKCVHNPLLMRRALEYVKAFGGVVAQHAQDPVLTQHSQMNEGLLSSRLGLQGWPAVAEESIIARDILLARTTDSHLHICHLSTRGSVEIVRFAKSKGISVTAEVTPHHLTLTEQKLVEYNPRYKVNPPLRTLDDVTALREGVADRTIDIVATDHAPHTQESKYCNFQDSAFGMTGLETALSAVQLSLVDAGYISWRQVAKIMSQTPAEIGQVAGQGQEIEIGAHASLVLYNPLLKRNVEPPQQQTASQNTPFKHHELPGMVVETYYKGKQTYSANLPR